MPEPPDKKPYDMQQLRSDRRHSLRMAPRQGLRKPNVKVAECLEEYEDAFRLAHDVYVDMGYMREEPSGVRLLPHHALPATTVFLAREERKVLGTVSLIQDGKFGLPMDELYAADLEPLRRDGLKIAEVSLLAVDSKFRWLLIDEQGKRRGLFWLLHQAVLNYSRRQGLDRLCITVNPRHVRFYESLYYFERFGDVKAYEKVCGAPAVALQLDLRTLPERLAADAQESERAFDMETFFFRMEHGFFQGEDRPPGMDRDVVRHFLVQRTHLVFFMPPGRAELLARLAGFDNLDELVGSTRPEPGGKLRVLEGQNNASG